jgi:transcriptional regulator with XRE-family HTH domain
MKCKKTKVTFCKVTFRRLLEDKNISTKDLANKLGITQTTLNNKISNIIRFTIDDIVKLGLILDINNINQLFKITNYEEIINNYKGGTND